MSEARQLTQASRCSLFLLDRKSNELVAKVFDGAQPPNNGKGAADGFEVRVLFKIRFARVLILRKKSTQGLSVQSLDFDVDKKKRTRMLCESQ